MLQLSNDRRQYQIHLKSTSGPIYVLLVNKDSDSSSPVVVQVFHMIVLSGFLYPKFTDMSKPRKFNLCFILVF